MRVRSRVSPKVWRLSQTRVRLTYDESNDLSEEVTPELEAGIV